MTRIVNVIIGILMCLIVLVSVRTFSKLPFGVGPVHYVAGFSLITIAILTFILRKRLHTWAYTFPVLYIIWAFIGVYRGQFEVTSAFIYNQYLHGILFVLSPICIFLFSHPDTVIRSFQILNVFNILYSFLSFGWNYTLEAYCFALTPFYYCYLCFFTKIPKNWQYITAVAVALVLAAHTNGSAFIKVVMCFGVLFVFLLPEILRNVCLHIGHWLMYIVPLVLLYLGLTGQYNIFAKRKMDTGVVVTVGANGMERHVPIGHIDTRTFIYEEMIASMIMHDHVMTGRTPARGYFSPSFAKDADKSIVGIDPGERHCSEVANLNTLHWLGLIGLILITLTYIQGSCLGLYCSNNKYLKCLSLECAFQWTWGWVENMNQFMMIDVMTFVMLAICYSPYFREMSDLEFECWFKSIFRKPSELHDYNKYQILKLLLNKKLENNKNTSRI